MKPNLIKEILEVQAQVPVSMTSDFDVIAPFLRNAEVAYVTNLIGQAQLTALKDAYDANTEDADLKEAILLCQKVIANLGYFFAVPVLSVSIGTSGIQVFSNQDTKQAFQWQVGDLKDALQDLGFSGIEEMLNFLESNPEKFSQYAASDELKRQKQYLISTAADFSQYFNINGSRYVFQAFAYLMKRVEDQTVCKTLGADFFESLKAPDLSEKKQYLVDKYIKPGIALLTASKAIVERIVNFQGGVITYNFRGVTGNQNQTQPVGVSQVADICTQLTTDGNQFLQDGILYINANLGDMTGFEPPVTRRRFGHRNDPCKGVFIP